MGVLVSYSDAFLGDDQVRTAIECRFYGLVFRVGDGTMKILQPASIGDAFMRGKSQIAVELYFGVTDVVFAADDFLLSTRKLHPVLQHVGVRGHVHLYERFGSLQLFLDALD